MQRRTLMQTRIHGGGYGAGNGQQDMSEIINANSNSFVAVSIQYRVSR
jgi:carboxylesterase type B